MGSPEGRRKRRRSLRARIGLRASYEGGMGYCRRISRLPNVAVLFSLFMVAAVCVRKLVVTSMRARSAELKAKARAAKSPLAVMLQEQHEIHYQAAALSDPANKCLTHSNGGHKQPTTFGVFTCVADARFLLRALVLTRKRAKGLGSLLVLDVGSPPPQDAGGITAGRAWDLRKTKTSQVNKRVKFREEPLPESSTMVLIEAHKVQSVDDWTDVILSVLQPLTPDGSIVIMEQRQTSISYRNTEEQDGTGPGSADLRRALSGLACGEAGLVVALGAFDEGLAVVRRAGADQSPLERGCLLDDVVDDGKPDDRKEGDTVVAAATATSAAAAAAGSSSAAKGTAPAARGTASAAKGTASDAKGTASDAKGTASDATGTASDPTGTASDATGTASAATGNASTATGTESGDTGTATAVTGAAFAATDADSTTTSPASASTGPASVATGTEVTANGAVALAPRLPLLHFEELFSLALGKDWSPRDIQTKFGGAEAVRKYAHRAGSRLFCVKNLARDSEGTGTKKQGGGGSKKLRSSKRNGGSESDTTPEQFARACLETHMRKHPDDVRGAFMLEMVLQAGGGADGVDVDRQLARLREEALTERGDAGLSLWKALHVRGARAGALGLLLP